MPEKELNRAMPEEISRFTFLRDSSSLKEEEDNEECARA
jgi:hypothetical protein